MRERKDDSIKKVVFVDVFCADVRGKNNGIERGGKKQHSKEAALLLTLE